MFFTAGHSEDGGSSVVVHSFGLRKSNKPSFKKNIFPFKKVFVLLFVILVLAFSKKKKQKTKNIHERIKQEIKSTYKYFDV